MTGLDRWVDSLLRQVADTLAPPPPREPWEPSPDHLTIDVCGPFDMSAAEYAEMVERRQTKERDRDAEGLHIHVRFEPWRARALRVEPPPAPSPPPFPAVEPPPPSAKTYRPGEGPEHVWWRWF